MDLNHGRLPPTDLQSVAIDHSAIPPHCELTGAGKGIRTSDLLITSQLLYRLSYTGFNKLCILQGKLHSVKLKYSTLLFRMPLVVRQRSNSLSAIHLPYLLPRHEPQYVNPDNSICKTEIIFYRSAFYLRYLRKGQIKLAGITCRSPGFCLFRALTFLHECCKDYHARKRKTRFTPSTASTS